MSDPTPSRRLELVLIVTEPQLDVYNMYAHGCCDEVVLCRALVDGTYRSETTDAQHALECAFLHMVQGPGVHHPAQMPMLSACTVKVSGGGVRAPWTLSLPVGPPPRLWAMHAPNRVRTWQRAAAAVMFRPAGYELIVREVSDD